MAAPKGNRNAAKGKWWNEAVRKAVSRPSDQKDDEGKPVKQLDLIAQKLVSEALDGNIQAIREVGDRLDGKAPQEVELNDKTDHTGSNLDLANRLAWIIRRGIEEGSRGDGDGGDPDMGPSTGSTGDGVFH